MKNPKRKTKRKRRKVRRTKELNEKQNGFIYDMMNTIEECIELPRMLSWNDLTVERSFVDV